MYTHATAWIPLLLLFAAAACDKNGPGADAPVTPDPALEEAPDEHTEAARPEEKPPSEPATADDGVDDDAETPETGAPTDEAPNRLRVGNDPCNTDSDCVPAECCHAAACVAKANAPDCTDVMCTMECRADTIDCGGGCLCFEGRCAARLNDLGAQPAGR